MTNLLRAVFELAIQPLRRPRQDNEVTTTRRTDSSTLPALLVPLQNETQPSF
jgi:hypothetical protein